MLFLYETMIGTEVKMALPYNSSVWLTHPQGGLDTCNQQTICLSPRGHTVAMVGGGLGASGYQLHEILDIGFSFYIMLVVLPEMVMVYILEAIMRN